MPTPGTRIFPGLPVAAVKPASAAAFALAITCTLAALLVRWLVGLADASVAPFPTFLASVLLTSIMAGRAAGLLAAALGLFLAGSAFYATVPTAFTPVGITLYALTAAAIIWIADQYRNVLRRLQEREALMQRQMSLIDAENDILSNIASGAPLTETFERITRAIEGYSGSTMLASILLLDSDGRHLRHGAAPSLPDAYNQAIDGVEIGPCVGSCGTAAFRKEPVFVTDIETDPLWLDYRDLARAHGLRACWSTPLLSHTEAVLGTFALYHREPKAPMSNEREIVALMSRLATSAVGNEHAGRQRELLVGELTHRVKNLLAVVQSIASSTLRASTNEASYAAFEARLNALSKAQGLLTQTQWTEFDLHDVVTAVVIEPFASDGRVVMDGPRIRLPSRLALPFVLSLHELSTNATKYGALSAEGGRVNINWGWAETLGAQLKLFLRWRESGGPRVEAPRQKGFGSRMIQRVFAGEANSEVMLDYCNDGVKCEINVLLEGQVSSLGG